ncbi:MAG: exonuclease SbcC [Colwellia sp.]|jgi:exonuclease SbcC
MIFNLFKSKNKWQHKDSNVRIASINEELDNNNSENKITLLSLLNDDKSELVRRAVLLKLNSFDDYYSASITNDNKVVQEFSYTQVQDILSGTHAMRLTVEQKQHFLSTHLATPAINFSLLNYWLDHETDPQIISDLFQTIIKKKNTSSLLLQTFSKKNNSEVQFKLLSLDLKELNEAPLLIKLSKKAVNKDVVQLIDNKLAQLIEQKEKPKRLLKQCQLLLSKLLALKDLSDFGQYLTKKAILAQEWQACSPELTRLSDEDQKILLTKYKKISAQLTQLFAPKEEAYHQAQIAEKLLQDKQVVKNNANKVITELSQILTTAVVKNDTLNETDFLNQLNQLNEELVISVLNQQEQDSFTKQIIQLEKRLTQLPEIAQSVSQATELISTLSQLVLPKTLVELNDSQQVYRDWLKEWQEVEQRACGILPQPIKDSHTEISQHWRNGLIPLQQEQKQLFAQTKKKFSDLKRLLLSGKYKVCFGLFKGVNQVITLLSVNQQQQLQRDFENISEQMAEISDWEHYIATPRKQQLLSDISALVITPMDNLNEQADKVKQYRKIWNSLGHADESVDQELNKEFNLACEQAFAPCRLFYGEQEKLREQHLATRNDIIAEVKELADSITETETDAAVIDFKMLDGQLNKLQQRWQQAGEVDRQRYQKLYRQFKNTLQPIRKAIKGFNDANGASKQALINDAEQLLDLENIPQAIDKVKQIQQQWREIGFAGTQQESALWQKFRSINDQVFAKREQFKTTQQTEKASLATKFNQTLIQIKAELADSQLIHSKAQAEQLLSDVLDNRPVIKSIVVAIESFISDITNKIAVKDGQAEQDNWRSLFCLLRKVAEDESKISLEILLENSTDDYQNLTSFWQKRLQEQLTLTPEANVKEREIKTLEIEILAQVESPQEYANQRLAVQVSLMQEQMLSGAGIDLSQSLINWLRLGKLTCSDIALLERLSKIYN